MKTPFPSWSKLPLLLALLLLAPRVGLAAEDAPLAHAPSTASAVPGMDERASLRLLEEPPAETQQRQRAPRSERLLAELGGGVVTSMGGGLVGGLLGLGLCTATSGNNNNYSPCMYAATAGVLLGAVLAYPLGVWWGGEATGGDGSLLFSFAGLGASVLMGALLGTVMPLLSPVAGILPLAGPIVAYELSQRPEPGPPAPTMASARPRLQPLLSVSSQGALLGLGGTF